MNRANSVSRIDSAWGWDQWNESLSTNTGMQCVIRPSEGRPSSRSESWRAGELTVIDLDVHEQHWSKVSDNGSHWIDDYMVVKSIKHGALVIEEHGSCTTFKAGSLVLIDPARKINEHFLDHVTVSVVLIPKQTLRSRGLIADLPSLLAPNTETPDIAAVRDFALCFATQVGATSTRTRHISASNFLNLMEILIADPLADQGNRSGQKLLFRAKQVIANHIGDTNLKPVSVAEELRISRGYLNHIFKVDGTTVMRYVWALRLEHAARLLAQDSKHRSQIQSIAYRCGFSSAAHFSRLFKERFGTSPRDCPPAEE